MGRYKLPIILGIIAIVVIILVILGIVFFKNRRDRDVITLYGNVDVRQVDIGFRVDGRVKAMPFEEGDFVPEGALMTTLDDQPYTDQVLEAQANVESIRTSLMNAESIYTRRTELVSIGGVSIEDYENAQSRRDVLLANLKEAEAALGVALSNLEYTRSFCPTDGTILTRIREPGTVVREADPVYTLSVCSPVWIRAFVSEPDLGLVYPGMEAKVYTDTKDGPVYTGQIGFISPIAEFTPKTVETTQLRTDLVYRIRVTVENPDRELKQGMPVTVKLFLNQGRGSSERRPGNCK